MADKPIIFSAPMVRALLDGRKAQTRRVLSINGRKGFFQFGESDLPDYDWTFRRSDHVWEDWRHDQLLRKLPYAIGDRLYVRENCATWEGGHRDVVYRSDLSDKDWSDLSHDARNGAPWKRRPSIHMPRWASRLTLNVTDVRVQRLQDISEGDVAAEGVTRGFSGGPHGEEGLYEDFAALWNSLHGPEAWDANPWVCAISFTVQRCNIDQVGQP